MRFAKLQFDASILTITVPGGVSRGADTAAGWAITSRLIAPGHLRVGLVNAQGKPLAPGLKEIARLVFEVELSGMGLRPVQDGSETHVTWDGSETHPTLLDIEPVDPRAGGYTWTAVDGSVAIAVPNAWHNAAAPLDVDADGETAPADVLAGFVARGRAEPADNLRDRVFQEDPELTPLEDVLADLVEEVVAAWRWAMPDEKTQTL